MDIVVFFVKLLRIHTNPFMRKLVYVLFFMLFWTALAAQVRYENFENVEWFSHIWGGGTQVPEFVEVDDSGNVYVAGTFQTILAIGSPLSDPDTLYFPRIWNPFGNPHLFFVKYSPEGEMRWFNTIERADTSLLRLWDFRPCSDGSFLVMGSFKDSVVTARGDDLKLQSAGFGTGSNAWCLKLFPNGHLETFVQAWGPGGGVFGYHIRERSDGTFVYIMSHYRFPVIIGADTISVDSSQLGNGRSHKTIAILDSVGKLMRFEVFISLEKNCVFEKIRLDIWSDDFYVMAYLLGC